MQETQNLKLKTYDFGVDDTDDFVNGVAGSADSNMHILDNAITEKVLLNGTTTNVNLTLSPSGDSINSIEVESMGVPKLYKKSKVNSGEWIEISYAEVRDLANYSYKFMY